MKVECDEAGVADRSKMTEWGERDDSAIQRHRLLVIIYKLVTKFKAVIQSKR